LSPRRPDIAPLRREDLDDDPIRQVAAWLERALAEAPLAEAMALATLDERGRPDARMVLLKGIDERGFRFFTHYDSAKGHQLAATPAAAVILYWRELDRQVRARGTVERLPAAESDAYFASRPHDARVGAMASPQSEPIGSREELERRVAEVEQLLAGAEPERPSTWGGYLLRPDEVELWQGQEARLHDRFRYTRDGDGWRIERLAP